MRSLTNPKWSDGIVPSRLLPMVAGAIVMASVLAANAAAQSATSLPVYEVTGTGIGEVQASKLATALNVPVEKLVARDSVVSFLDAEEYLAIPAVPVTEPAVLEKLRSSSVQERPGLQLAFKAADFAALEKLPVLEDEKALKKTSDALAAAGIHLAPAKPVVGHTTFTASFVSGDRAGTSLSHDLNTRVSYDLFTEAGHPLIGPGAQIQVTYDGSGKVVRLLYATRELKAGPSVKIFSEDEARKRVAAHFPPDARINFKLVYWCPSLRRAPGKKAPLSPKFIIPWYAFNSVIPVTNPKTGAVTETHTKIQMIPATDDPRFVPSVRLKASGRERVEASVEVRGGRAPYTCMWSGSNPAASEQAGASISYEPVVRAVPLHDVASERTSLARRETLGVTVTDANGIMLQENLTLSVIARLLPLGKGGPAASYGTESPREPDFAVDRIGWQNGMATPGAGGGTQVFAWLGDLAWPGDFIEPKPQGTLMPTPWVNGDADYSNWGVNSAAIVLNNTDGGSTGFDSSEPGATIAQYATAALSATDPTVTIGMLNSNETATTQYFNIDLTGSWTPVGPNDQLLWLLMDACDIMDATSPAGTPQQRWGPMFSGLHIMTGWNSEEQLADGSFEQDFAENILGVNGAPQTILQAWFNAAQTAGIGPPPAHGLPAAMGPITTGNVTDKDDYYIGKGSQGPTIMPANVTGWWYIHD